MNIVILGYGDQGRSAYEYWGGRDNTLTICDKNTSVKLPSGAQAQLGPAYLKGLGQFDLIVRSPSVHPRDIVENNSPEILAKVTTVTSEFFKVCPSKNIIGVTGTKGKGTTSTLITKILEGTGRRVHLGGNIGTPPLDLLKDNIKPDDSVVLELANFQLIDLKYSPHIAVCLMVVPEHLDWHTDMDEYLAAKQQLFAHQAPDDIAVYFSKNESSKKVVSVSPGRRIPYFAEPGAIVEDNQIKIAGQNICQTNELKLLGQHNWQNVCAAVTAVWQVTQDVSAIKPVLTSFAGLPHRLELVRELDGVKYYDDSFGTTPETAIVAIEAFKAPKIIVLGGSDKGSNYQELAESVARHNIRAVVLIGQMASKIRAALEAVGYDNFIEGRKTMNEIVAAAKTSAQPGDIVLLSTACASFDLFKNYKDRGEQFKKAVQALV